MKHFIPCVVILAVMSHPSLADTLPEQVPTEATAQGRSPEFQQLVAKYKKELAAQTPNGYAANTNENRETKYHKPPHYRQEGSSMAATNSSLIHGFGHLASGVARVTGAGLSGFAKGYSASRATSMNTVPSSYTIMPMGTKSARITGYSGGTFHSYTAHTIGRTTYINGY